PITKDMRSFDDFCTECDKNNMETFTLQLQINSARSLRPSVPSNSSIHHGQNSLPPIQEMNDLNIWDSRETVDNVEDVEEELMEEFLGATTTKTEGFLTDKKNLETYDDMMLLIQT